MKSIGEGTMIEKVEIVQIRAKKRHSCHLCGKDILPGGEYIREKYVYDRQFCTISRHLHCDSILQAFFESSEYFCDEYSDSDVCDYLHNVCSDLNNKGKCSDDDYFDNCDMDRCFDCPLIIKEILSPSIQSAMMDDIRANQEEKK